MGLDQPEPIQRQRADVFREAGQMVRTRRVRQIMLKELALFHPRKDCEVRKVLWDLYEAALYSHYD